MTSSCRPFNGPSLTCSLTFVLQEDEETARIKEQRLADYAAKKAKSTSPCPVICWTARGRVASWFHANKLLLFSQSPHSSPSLQSYWTSSLGTMRLTWRSWRSASAVFRWTGWSGDNVRTVARCMTVPGTEERSAGALVEDINRIGEFCRCGDDCNSPSFG